MTYEYKKGLLINLLLIVTLTGAAVCFLRYIPGYVLPFVIGVIIAFSVQKPSRFISERSHIKKEICAVVLTVCICIFSFSMLILLILAVGSRILDFLPSVPRYLSDFEEYFFGAKDDLMKNFHALTQAEKNSVENIVSQAADSLVTNATGLLSGFATGLVKNLPAFLITSIVTVVASCYIAKDFERLKKFVTGILSVERTATLKAIKRAFQENALKLIKGYALISLITFAELTLAFLILGVNDPLYVAALVALVDVLPVLGVGTVLLPWSAIEFLTHNYSLGTGLLAAYCVIIVVRNFIEPRIIGSQMGINPIFTMFSMFLGLKIAGVSGMIISPLVLTVAISYYKNNL